MLELWKRKALNLGGYWIGRVRLGPILRSLPPLATVIDCGANCGKISALLAKHAAQVIAFEPDPLAFAALVQRVKPFSNVECIQKGVGAQAGEFFMYLHKDKNGHRHTAFTVSSSLSVDKVNIDPERSIKVEVIDFIDYLDSFEQKVDLVKMDIEGAEIDILERLLEGEAHQKVGLMIVETHESKIPNHRERLERIKKTMQEKEINHIKLNWI